MENPISKAIAAVGSQAALAQLLGVTPGLVSQWKNGIRPLAPRHCRKIQDATQGRVTVHELCPEVFGSPNEV